MPIKGFRYHGQALAARGQITRPVSDTMQGPHSARWRIAKPANPPRRTPDIPLRASCPMARAGAKSTR